MPHVTLPAREGARRITLKSRLLATAASLVVSTTNLFATAPALAQATSPVTTSAQCSGIAYRQAGDVCSPKFVLLPGRPSEGE